jgi:prepilin-type N-terminal cleavage/methylation domain-containing protein
MKSHEYNAGFTLVEMLIVVAIIALLATMVVGLAARIDTQSKERGLKSTFTLLDGALQEYYDYWKAFPDPNKAPYLTHSAALYGQLYSTPTSRKILEEISSKLIRDNPPQIYDPWGALLDYRYKSGDNFPLLVSAGPDKSFVNTTDNISNR